MIVICRAKDYIINIYLTNENIRNEVWTLEKPPQDARIIGTKWVFRNKQDDQGVIVRNKARNDSHLSSQRSYHQHILDK